MLASSDIPTLAHSLDYKSRTGSGDRAPCRWPLRFRRLNTVYSKTGLVSTLFSPLVIISLLGSVLNWSTHWFWPIHQWLGDWHLLTDKFESVDHLCIIHGWVEKHIAFGYWKALRVPTAQITNTPVNSEIFEFDSAILVEIYDSTLLHASLYQRLLLGLPGANL